MARLPPLATERATHNLGHALALSRPLALARRDVAEILEVARLAPPPWFAQLVPPLWRARSAYRRNRRSPSTLVRLRSVQLLWVAELMFQLMADN